MLPASPVFFLCNFHPTFLCFESMLTWWLSSIALEIWTGSLVQPVRSKTQHVILSVTYKATWQCVFNWTTINPGNGAPQPSSGRMAQSSISMHLNIHCDQGQWVKWNDERSSSFLIFSISVSHGGGHPRWLSDKESAYQCRRHRRCEFNPWVTKIPWRRKWQPAPILLPGKSHGLVGYCPWCCKKLDTTERLSI